MMTEAIGLAIAGIGALAYGIRTLIRGREVPGRIAHALARVVSGGVLLAGGIGLALGAITFLTTAWVWGAVAIAYGSILIELLQIVGASRRRRLSEGARLRRHVSESGSKGA